MQLPDATTLREIPGLAAWLRKRPWKEGFEQSFDKIMARVRVDEILEKDDYPPVMCRHGNPELMLECRSIDSGRHVCISQIAFVRGYDRLTRRAAMDAICYCTCGQKTCCPHAMAAFEKLLAIIGGSDTPKKSALAMRQDMLLWLKELEQAVQARESAPKPRPYQKFLAYCIEPEPGFRHRGPGGLCLVPRVGNPSQDGATIEKSIAQPDLSRMPKYLADEDVPIIAKLAKWKRENQAWSGLVAITGEGWDAILDDALATGRLFAANRARDTDVNAPSHIPLQAGPEITAVPAWRRGDDGTAQPVLDLPDPDIELLPTDPLRYIDRANGRLGHVGSHLPAKLLLAWPNGPAVPSGSVADVGQALVKLPVSSPLPVPEDRPPTEIKGRPPEPVLHIREVRTGIYQKRHIGGLLLFRYGGGEAFHPLAEGAPAATSWYEGDTRFILERDAAAEARLAGDLEARGLTPLHRIFPAGDLNDRNRHSVVPGEPTTDPRAWLEFLDGPAAQALRDAGWTIESDSRLSLDIHDVRDFFPEIEEDASGGIDWFRFDVTGECDGRKISLIPHIAHAIREDWPSRYADPETRPDTLLLPCDDPADGHIRFPADRFLDIVARVRHLFHGADDLDGPFRLDRIQAAGVADALEVNANATMRALAALGRNLRDIRGVPAVEPPATLRAALRPYQADGFRWLQFLARNGLHGILADDMGLGKTVQTLAHLAAETQHAAGRPSLVIAPTSVVSNWAAEAEKFTPTLKTLVLHGSDRGDHFEAIPAQDVVFTTYPLLLRDIDVLRGQDWHAVVLDEAQYIKNPKARVSRDVCGLRAVHRVCLSGTPVENHLGELWSLMRFLMPGLLGNEKTFNSRLRRPIERGRDGHARLALSRRVSPLILRRTKDQVATELPEKTTLVHRIDLDGKQTDLYESVRAAMDARVRHALAEKGLAQSQIIVLDAMLKLRQICCHPRLLKGGAAGDAKRSAKLEFLGGELLPTLLEEGRRILLFSQFTSMLELIAKRLEAKEIPHLKLTGRTRNRAALVGKFQAGGFPVFLISLKAGGTGLNLTAADTVIHYDPWWNPAAEDQATDRAHRIGQQKPVFVHKLVCAGTIEERILDLQRHKAALVKSLLSEDISKLKIDAATLSHLFSPIG